MHASGSGILFVRNDGLHLNLRFGLSPSPRGAKRQGDKAGGSANRKTTGYRSDRKSLNKNALLTLAASVVHKENSTLKPQLYG